jgi:hypothetical protein
MKYDFKRSDPLAFFLQRLKLTICKKNYSFLMFFMFLCVFSVIPAHAGYYYLSSIKAVTNCPYTYESSQYTYNLTAPNINTNQIYITGVDAPFSGTYTYTYTWSEAGTKPPATVYFLETAQATGFLSGSGSGSGVSANDGLEDAGTYPYGGNTFMMSKGTHYVGMAGTSTITITVKPSVNVSGPGRGIAGYILSVSLVNKGGYISTSLGATYHKGAPVLDIYGNQAFDSNGLPAYSQDPDTYDASGVFQANTVMPTSGTAEAIAYSANAAGVWGSNSSWLLHVTSQDTDSVLASEIKAIYALASTSNADSGNFDGGTNNNTVRVGTYNFWYLNQFETYSYPVLPGISIELDYTNSIFSSEPYKEHVKMTLTDGADGSICSENYYLIFHQPIENWQKNGALFEIAPAAGAPSAVVPAGTPVTVVEPQATGSYSDAEQTISGILATGACLIVTKNPVVARSLQALMTAAAVTLSYQASVTPPGTSQQSGDGAQLHTDVTDEMSILNQVPVTDCAAAYAMTNRFADDSIARQLADTCYTDQDYNAAIIGHALDPTSKNYMLLRYSITRYCTVFQQNWVSDGYGTQGYCGSTSGSTTCPGGESNLFLWSEVTGPAAPSSSDSSSSSSTPSVTSD